MNKEIQQAYNRGFEDGRRHRRAGRITPDKADKWFRSRVENRMIDPVTGKTIREIREISNDAERLQEMRYKQGYIMGVARVSDEYSNPVEIRTKDAQPTYFAQLVKETDR